MSETKATARLLKQIAHRLGVTNKLLGLSLRSSYRYGPLIVALRKSGISGPDVAEIVGTSIAAVNNTVQRSRRQAVKEVEDANEAPPADQ